MKVLIIEDEPTDRKLKDAVLKMSGHIVRERATAEEAVDAITADKPDVIGLDLRLPGMDGLTLARQLKVNPGTGQIPMVAITAYPELPTRGIGCRRLRRLRSQADRHARISGKTGGNRAKRTALGGTGRESAHR
jgi:CheY-like chemotaxis protein